MKTKDLLSNCWVALSDLDKTNELPKVQWLKKEIKKKLGKK